MTISAETFNVLRSAVNLKNGVHLGHLSAWLDEIEKDVDFSDTIAPVFKKPVRSRSYGQSSLHEWMNRTVKKDCENQAELLMSKTDVQAQHRTSILVKNKHTIRNARIDRWLDGIHQEHDSHHDSARTLRPGSPEPKNLIPADPISHVDDNEDQFFPGYGVTIILNPPTEPEVKDLVESSSVDITEQFKLEADTATESEKSESFATPFSEAEQSASFVAFGLLVPQIEV